MPMTTSEITDVPRQRRNDSRPSPCPDRVVDLRRLVLGVPAQQEPRDPAEHAGDQQRAHPAEVRGLLDSVLQGSGVIAERRVLHVEQDQHHQRAEQAGGNPGQDHQHPEPGGENAGAVAGDVRLLHRAAAGRQPLPDQRLRVPRSLADPDLPPVARSAEPAPCAGVPRPAAWTGHGTLTPAGRPDTEVRAVSSRSTRVVPAARTAHHWLTPLSGARLACRRVQRPDSPASQLRVAAGSCSSIARNVNRRSPIRWPTPASPAASARRRRVRMIPLRTGLRSAPTRSPRLPSAVGAAGAARSASGSSGGTGCALISAPMTIRVRPAPGGDCRRREIEGGVEVGGQPRPQVLPEQCRLGSGQGSGGRGPGASGRCLAQAGVEAEQGGKVVGFGRRADAHHSPEPGDPVGALAAESAVRAEVDRGVRGAS